MCLVVIVKHIICSISLPFLLFIYDGNNSFVLLNFSSHGRLRHTKTHQVETIDYICQFISLFFLVRHIVFFMVYVMRFFCHQPFLLFLHRHFFLCVCDVVQAHAHPHPHPHTHKCSVISIFLHFLFICVAFVFCLFCFCFIFVLS